MNRMVWIGILAWGIIVTLFGFSAAGPVAAGSSATMQAQDVVFLIAGGLVACLIALVGLAGVFGWLPVLQNEQKTYS
ncbi:hypothetical protein F2P45_23510 [Massilia sp. CCM 8733]|uniref:Uncharacterized protein n=1 Tax=Massilia mucilaginosa TaxID=2609282 RepID=A0ABX0NZD0_9BURK|nr:hypothetical protein [Massilia mucilaginosa]NHZ91950.1 hypothetical protein [Massilia mucilaginosa]